MGESAAPPRERDSRGWAGVSGDPGPRPRVKDRAGRMARAGPIPRVGALSGGRARFQSCREATMPERRRASRRTQGILAGALVLTATVLGVRYGFFGAGRGGSQPP